VSDHPAHDRARQAAGIARSECVTSTVSVPVIDTGDIGALDATSV